MATAGFDPSSATIKDVHRAIIENGLRVTDILDMYLSRIVHLNPVINALITLSPDAISEAKHLDHLLAETHKECNDFLAQYPLFGIPTVLKDNFDSPPMPTTAGCLALSNCFPTTEAPTVTAFKRAGAIIVGKANMHELALEGLTVSSLGGQTLNPYDLTRTPGGSSGGSAAALAAGLAVIATGSDTVNSLRSPASACSLMSCRPTRGLISRSGVALVADTHDAIGPICKCVSDVATVLDVMKNVGFDEGDRITALRPDNISGVEYARNIDDAGLSGYRVGLVKTFLSKEDSEETTPVNAAMARVVGRLEAHGVEVIPIEEDIYDSPRILTDLDVQRFEYREQLTAYLQRPESGGHHPPDMPALYNDNKYVVIPSQYEHINASLHCSTSDREYLRRKKGIEDLKLNLASTFARNRLDALIYPQQKNLVVKVGAPNQSGRNGILGALTGTPVVVVPVGYSSWTIDAPRGLPIGMEILGRPWTEDKLFRLARYIERVTNQKGPLMAGTETPAQGFKNVPEIVPLQNVESCYPIGRRD